MVSKHNKWDDAHKLTNVIFYLTDVARLWFRNHSPDLTTWSAFRTAFVELFGRPELRKLRAEQRLRGRAQRSGESYTSYIEDVVALCRRINQSMAEAEKIKHILKGVSDDAFQMLIAKDPQTVAEVIQLCQSYDELWKQRDTTRRASASGETIAALTSTGLAQDHAALFQEIKQFVREEVARQLSLLPCIPDRAPSTLPTSIQRVVREQVAEVLPAAPAPPVTAPLTYAEALVTPRRLPAANPYVPPNPFVSSPQPVHQTTRPLSRPAPHFPNPWRTPDNRPICYACGFPGHVARFCRRRELMQHDDMRPHDYDFAPRSQTASSGPHVTTDFSSTRRNYHARRSPSPRRRSLSPMLRRPRPVPEEN